LTAVTLWLWDTVTIYLNCSAPNFLTYLFTNYKGKCIHIIILHYITDLLSAKQTVSINSYTLPLPLPFFIKALSNSQRTTQNVQHNANMIQCEHPV